jgi:sigma-B regulation protein RsbU (phosphoserine phosphatase)
MLSTLLGAVVVLSGSAMMVIGNMRNTTLTHSVRLGDSAANNSEAALVFQVRQQLMSLAQDKAAFADQKLIAIQNQTTMIADVATHIFTHKREYAPKPIGPLNWDLPDLLVPHIGMPEDMSVNDFRDELYLAANVGDMLRQFTVVDIGILANYIGAEAGYTIIVERNPVPSVHSFDARTRDWYRGAKEKGDIFWSDIFSDSSGRGFSVSCAKPFYDLSNNGRVLKGVAGCGFLLSETVNKIIDSTKIGETGYAFLLNEKGHVVITPMRDDIVIDEQGMVIGNDYLNSENAGLRELARNMVNREIGLMELELGGEAVYIAYHPLSTTGWSLGVVAVIDEVIGPAMMIKRDILTLTGNAIGSINTSILMMIFIMVIVIALTVFVSIFVARHLADNLTAPIVALSDGAKIIGSGNLIYRFHVHSGDEIETLAGTFNQMIDNIETITAEKQRINSELSVASDIQNDMLPRIFPKFSSHKLISLFAKMEPAKEVGGDFFDFFYLDEAETKIAFVIADVSGKGVPAALFMVIAKTLIKQQMLQSGDPAHALEQVNKILCEDNPRCMFVTTLIYALDLNTGQMLYANGGHNPPLLARTGEPYQFMPLQKGIPPGMMEESRYKLSLTQLLPGDKLYLYTDGVNEAMNKAGEQFGNERFLHTANLFRDLSPEDFDKAIRNEVCVFVNGAEQSDDITTVAIAYTGNKEEGMGNEEMLFDKEITVAAKIEALDRVIKWVAELLSAGECPPKMCNQIAVATEELFVNIASYAYGGGEGEVVLRAGIRDGRFVMQLEDSGVAFNSLDQPPPDVTAAIEDREIGGLGIFLTRKWMDKLVYERILDRNVLTMYKRIKEKK